MRIHVSLACIAVLWLTETSGLYAQELSVPSNSPRKLVEDLHSAFGKHHERAVHAKGIIVDGFFQPSAQAPEYCKAQIFTAVSPIRVRFSDFTGLPDIPDNSGDASPHGFAVKFTPADGSEFDIVAHSYNGFPVATAADFGLLLQAIAKSDASVKKPTPLDLFLSDHPIARAFLTSSKPPPESYGTVEYYGVNSFSFENRVKERHFVRYRFTPAEGDHYLDSANAKLKKPDYLSEEIKVRLQQGPVRFYWYAQFAADGDKVGDPSIAWPEGRNTVLMGTISLDRVSVDQSSLSKSLLFLPTRLPDGIEPADPMLQIRSAAYPISFSERQ